MAEIRMPKMGDGMEEGAVLRWLKAEGDPVTADEPIAEIETDKANVEIPAEESGRMGRVVVAVGETVPVGAVIAYLVTDESTVDATHQPPAHQPVGSAPVVVMSAPGEATSQSRPTAAGPRIRVSPLARRMARRLGVDLAAVKGSGGGVGRVVAGDVLAMSEHLRSPRDVEPAPADTQESLGEEVGKMRRAIARRTVQSKQTIPHFYVTMPIDMDRALDMLEQLNTATPDRKITVNDLVVKASAAALGRYPDVNVSYTPDERLVRHPSMNIGVAVGTDDGLRIPVVTDCGHRSLRDLSAEVRRLVGRTKSGALTPQEMSGGTFTVSNLGMLGVEEFAAIVNPPEAAILAVGAAAPEVTVDQNGAFVARRRMRVTLSCDHRVVDGVLGARFLQEVKRLLEAPCLLLE